MKDFHVSDLDLRALDRRDLELRDLDLRDLNLRDLGVRDLEITDLIRILGRRLRDWRRYVVFKVRWTVSRLPRDELFGFFPTFGFVHVVQEGAPNVRSLWSNIFRRGDREEQDLHELLAGIPLFERLNRRELQAVAKILYRRQYKPGEYIFHQGDIGIGMYVVERGTVVIQYEPTDQRLTDLHEGDFFGEVALLNETRRSAAARAEAETTLLCMLEPDLEDLGTRNPRVGFKVLSSLARIAGRRLIAISDEYEELRLRTERQPASDAARTPAHEVQGGDGQTEAIDDRAGDKVRD